MKTLKVVEPYLYNHSCNFKYKTWEAWRDAGVETVDSWYPRLLHKLLFTCDLLPTICQSKKEVRLCFASPSSLYFDTWTSTPFYETIPFLWDCWEDTDDKVCSWMIRHKVKACIFTSALSAERISKKLPHLNTFVVTEGINTELYQAGKELGERTIDLYYFGRQPDSILNADYSDLTVAVNGSDAEFFERMTNSRMSIAVPRCDVNPACHETLTQRYWECMLSRTVMVGRAPKELTSLIGYNPVINIDYQHYVEQIKDISAHIEDYQPMVNRNRETALAYAPWENRIKAIMEWLDKKIFKKRG